MANDDAALEIFLEMWMFVFVTVKTWKKETPACPAPHVRMHTHILPFFLDFRPLI